MADYSDLNPFEKKRYWKRSIDAILQSLNMINEQVFDDWGDIDTSWAEKWPDDSSPSTPKDIPVIPVLLLRAWAHPYTYISVSPSLNQYKFILSVAKRGKVLGSFDVQAEEIHEGFRAVIELGIEHGIHKDFTYDRSKRKEIEQRQLYEDLERECEQEAIKASQDFMSEFGDYIDF